LTKIFSNLSSQISHLKSQKYEGLIDIIEHPNSEKYPNQKALIVLKSDYVYMVPFVETETEYFLKTIIPSRKLTKNYRNEIK
jgi:hypothetical protein